MNAERLESADPAEDRRLARAAAAGDRRAATAVADRLYERIRALVFYVTGGDRDAEDLVQMAMIEILRSLDNYRGESALEKWADRIAVRTALRHIRRRSWRERFHASLDAGPEHGSPAGQHVSLTTRELRRRLLTVLGRMKERHRTVLVLHWMAGYSVQEIATIVDAPANTVRERLRTGKKRFHALALKDPLLAEYAHHGEVAP